MKQNRSMKQRLAAGLLGGLLAVSLICTGTVAICAQGDQQVTLEKTASWESAENYQAAIDLKVSGIEECTQREVPISVIPVLDVTSTMNYCETLGHFHKMFYHWVGDFENASQIWRDILVPSLPEPKEYAQMGMADPDNMFLELPEELDPFGKCRMVYLKGRAEQRDYYAMTHWHIFYVTDDETPLCPLKEGSNGAYGYSHAILRDGRYLPVGTAQEAGVYTAWSYTNYPEAGHGCLYSRLDQLKDGYAQFIQALFENPGTQVCPVAFVGGYYINGWTDDVQEAVDFIVQETYLDKEAVMPDYNYGTNYEAALAGAMDAADRLDKKENTFVILFTDGDTSSGYDHTSGTADYSRLDSHSFGMPNQDESWYPVYANWAVEDAEVLKETAAVYTVGYGSSLELESSMSTLQKISSGGEYFIDTRSTSIQTITDIFQTIYSDIIYKATKVQIVDYISEFWNIEEEKLPEGCKVEEISITNQKGQPDTIYKVTYPITREMGADGQEEVRLPIVLREAYRDVAEKTLYETNQDEPFEKDQEGAGAYVEYVDQAGDEKRTFAETPQLDVYPGQTDFLLEKKALTPKVKAGEEAQYEFCLKNLSQVDFTDIWLGDVFSEADITLLFDQAEGTRLEEDGESICIEHLGRGEEIVITGQAEIPEDFQGVLTNIATAATGDIKKQAEACVDVIPLQMDFEVEKTVDKEQAFPGETLTYQICIVNTGERELCSVVATDKFADDDIQAVFQEQEEVILKKDKTQAQIESILPGEEKILTATAEIPVDFAKEELTNTVFVSVDGGKEKEKTAQVSVEVQKGQPNDDSLSGNQEHQSQIEATVTAAPTKSPSMQNQNRVVTSTPRATYTATGTGSDGKGTAAASYPETGDSSSILPWMVLTAIAAVTAAVLGYCRLCHRKKGER